MQTHPTQFNNSGISLSSNIELVIDLLESGHSVELLSSGYSMFPTFKPGDTIIINRLGKDELPKPGNILIYRNGEGLVMHRFIESVRQPDDGIVLVTRGDSRKEPDIPWQKEQLLGIAVQFIRNKKEHPVKSYIPGFWRYRYNLRILQLKNLKMKLFDTFLRLKGNREK